MNHIRPFVLLFIVGSCKQVWKLVTLKKIGPQTNILASRMSNALQLSLGCQPTEKTLFFGNDTFFFSQWLFLWNRTFCRDSKEIVTISQKVSDWEADNTIHDWRSSVIWFGNDHSHKVTWELMRMLIWYFFKHGLSNITARGELHIKGPFAFKATVIGIANSTPRRHTRRAEDSNSCDGRKHRSQHRAQSMTTLESLKSFWPLNWRADQRQWILFYRITWDLGSSALDGYSLR